MFDFAKWFSVDSYVYQVEVMTIVAVLLLLGYIFFILNVFKKG